MPGAGIAGYYLCKDNIFTSKLRNNFDGNIDNSVKKQGVREKDEWDG